MRKITRGFTIVELLIVIVVIAILAAIGIVAYNGIQNRADDAAIQNDLSSLAKKIQLVAADLGEYPAGGATRSGGTSDGSQHLFPGVRFSPSKSAYMTTVHNLYYCTGIDTSSEQSIFRLFARSKSGNSFRYSSDGGLQNLGNTGFSASNICLGMNDPQTWSYGYYSTSSSWQGWTDG